VLTVEESVPADAGGDEVGAADDAGEDAADDDPDDDDDDDEWDGDWDEWDGDWDEDGDDGPAAEVAVPAGSADGVVPWIELTERESSTADDDPDVSETAEVPHAAVPTNRTAASEPVITRCHAPVRTTERSFI
jgi:hypothetical protein